MVEKVLNPETIEGANTIRAQSPPTGELRRDLRLFRGGLDAFGFRVWTVFDPVSDKYYKLGEDKYRVLSCLDRDYPLDEFMEKLKANGINMSMGEVWQLLTFLRNSGLMLPEYGEAEKRITGVALMKRRMLPQMILSTYLFFRVPLIKPDRFLDWSVGTVRAMFNPWILWLLGLLALSGYLSLIPAWNLFTEELWNSISFEGLLRYSLAVILIKCVHEFAHAYTAKNFGIRVRRMGLAFIVFFPRLYTDLTDAWRIADRRKRALVDAAGILSEAVIGGMAALVWTNTGPGAVHTISYYVFAVSVINTVLVNGNPFIRYDGYYILMDMVNIDNLQKRGADSFRRWYRRVFFGLEEATEHYREWWKNGFLWFFGVSGFLYRIFLYTSIILIVYIKFTKTIGIILLLLEVYLLIVKPILTEGRSLMSQRTKFKPKSLILAYAMLALVLLPLILPLPWIISSPCEVRSADSTVVYMQSDGFISAIPVKDGDTVEKDAVLFRFVSPFLDWQFRRALLDRSYLLMELDQIQTSSETIGPLKVKQQQLLSINSQIDELRRRQRQLELCSPSSGLFVMFDPDMGPGKFVMRGAPLGEVFNPQRLKVSAFVKEEDIDLIREGDRVYVTMENRLEEIPGRVSLVKPVPESRMFPSPVLSVFGGPLVSRRSSDYEFELLQPYYQVTIEPDPGAQLSYGCTGTVRVRKFSIIGVNIFRKICSVLNIELTF